MRRICSNELLLTLLLVLGMSCKTVKQLGVTYIPSVQCVTLYTASSSKINLQISFESKEVMLHKSLEREVLYFSIHGGKDRYKIDNTNNVYNISYNYTMKSNHGIEILAEGEEQKEINHIKGVIGLKEHSHFIQIMKTILSVDDVKIQFKHFQGIINVIPHKCTAPIFPPYTLSVSSPFTEISSVIYKISHLSTVFHPYPQTFATQIFNQKNIPFEMTKHQLKQDLTLALANKITSIPVKHLLKCSKYANSEKYQCDLHQSTYDHPKKSTEVDVGLLMLAFNPIICNVGIELERENSKSDSYYYQHVVLLVGWGVCIVLLAEANKIIETLRRVRKGKRF